MTALTFDPIEPLAPSAIEALMAEESARLLAPALAQATGPVQLHVAGTKEAVAIPAAAFGMLVQLLTEMGSGNAVRVVPHHAELTTQEAADLLNVSRPYLVRILDEGRIPFHRTGTHRRVLFKDLMAYKAQHRRARVAALDKLSDLDQELGLT